ncbi:PLP-dependent aminotransferase family protein [Bifidobacterium callitrichos]|uniref:PLP-dependent aminotransferase family protein n=1 Tax=Bifidobacterium callitrichos TaxID=762209 RepID=A0A5M9ZEW7_9BIFI|nr:PLP-dependent aminotransferase family protein [Bifidobacterium callitrichos]KAA8817588.1 PLP-dependent aminotransferase family protein [Bifidobacterium callitrichos]
MRLTVDRHSGVPMYRQLAAQLRESIVSGALAEGYRLPPERELAARLEVNRTTVLQAYQQLKDEGLIASKVGKGTFVLPATSAASATSGTTVASVPPASVDATGATALSASQASTRVGSVVDAGIVSAKDRGTRSASGTGRSAVHTIRDGLSGETSAEPPAIRPPWSILFSDYSNRFTYHDIAEADRAQRGGSGGRDDARPHPIDFATGSPNPADIPDDLLRAVSLEAFASHEFDGQPESPIEGFDELRDLLAKHMRDRGVGCDARNVMVLSGSEQGIDLIVRAFVNPGDCVLVEQSTFFPALQTFRSADARIVGVPVDGDGMRTDLLEGYCARFHPKLIYTIPTFHNPTGTTMPIERRRTLVDVARRYQCLIVEDDAYGDLWYGDGHRPIPLAGMENTGYVMYLSTFSKTVTSGLRTGWVVADPHVIARLAALRRMVDQHTSTSSQRICLELLKEGRIAGHVASLAAAYRTRRDVILDALERYMPHDMRWTRPQGGYYIWATLPGGVRALDLLGRCRARGVTFMPGGVFDVDESDDAHIRLNMVRPDAADLERGIQVIGESLNAM